MRQAMEPFRAALGIVTELAPPLTGLWLTLAVSESEGLRPRQTMPRPAGEDAKTLPHDRSPGSDNMFRPRVAWASGMFSAACPCVARARTGKLRRRRLPKPPQTSNLLKILVTPPPELANRVACTRTHPAIESQLPVERHDARLQIRKPTQ